jgi:galactose mutarotase-like enzyme
VRNGRYDFEGRQFALPVGHGGHASHGFAKDARWDVVEKRESSATMRALLSGGGYPGVLDAEVTYAVRRAASPRSATSGTRLPANARSSWGSTHTS